MGKSRGKVKGKQQAMEGEEQVSEVTEETWREGMIQTPSES